MNLIDKLKNYIHLIRPHHYLKNLFIFVPLFFGLKITDRELLVQSVYAFIFFSAAASSIYVFNDIFDRDKDRQHSKNKNRPIASGKVTIPEAIVIFLILASVAILGAYAFNKQLLIVISLYLVINFAYSTWLKKIAIIDVLLISLGFVLRLFAGSVVTGIVLSMWLVLMTFLITLFMGFAKRRDDVLIFNKTGKSMREALDGYNLEFLNISMSMVATASLVAYIMYTVSSEVTSRLGTDKLYLTSVFVVVGILRYFQLVFVHEKGHSPTQILINDRLIQLSIVFWIITFAFLIY